MSDKQEERILVLEQAKLIAKSLDQPAYVVECAWERYTIVGIGRWFPSYAIRLDNDPYLHRYKILPDGTVQGCEQLT